MKLAELRALLDRRGLQLQRDRGQNFLVDPNQADRLVQLAGVGAEDLVVEVGTGLGALTRALARRCSRVITLEIDSGVVRALREEPDLLPSNAELHHVDALRCDLRELVEGLPRERVRLVANLPYSAATPLLRKMLDLRESYADWCVMVQREVAERLAAPAGSSDYGSFAVLHALAARVEVLASLPAEAFFPAPQVLSSFVRVQPKREASIAGDELRRVERVVRAVFGQRRKTIANGLKAGSFERECVASALESCGIDPRERAEKLEPQRLRELTAALAAASPQA